MNLLGNLLWLIFGGFLAAICWGLAGCIWCITIVGIPVGLQCFKMMGLSLWPFGRDIVYGTGTVSFLMNILWLLFSGLELCIGHLALGAVLCMTIIGIPFGMQNFKMARLALMPFGAEIIQK